MAFDEGLAERIRDHLEGHRDVVEKKMFGGLAFMYRGNMAVGVHKDGLMVRIAPEDHETALALSYVRQFDMTGRPMTGWIVVEGEVLGDEALLAEWVERGMAHAGSLPPK